MINQTSLLQRITDSLALRVLEITGPIYPAIPVINAFKNTLSHFSNKVLQTINIYSVHTWGIDFDSTDTVIVDFYVTENGMRRANTVSHYFGQDGESVFINIHNQIVRREEPNYD